MLIQIMQRGAINRPQPAGCRLSLGGVALSNNWCHATTVTEINYVCANMAHWWKARVKRVCAMIVQCVQLVVEGVHVCMLQLIKEANHACNGCIRKHSHGMHFHCVTGNSWCLSPQMYFWQPSQKPILWWHLTTEYHKPNSLVIADFLILF